MKHEVDWAKLLDERKQRLKKMIELNAPDVIIYMAARTLLKTETHNSKWRAIWKWVTWEIGTIWRSFKSDLGIWRLRLQGWPKACALAIYFGDSKGMHSKSGCKCDEDFEREMVRVLRREQS